MPGEVDALVHLVDLFQADLARLVHHAVNEYAGQRAEGPPYVEHFGTHVEVATPGPDHIRRAVGDAEVEEPVGCC